MKYDFEAAFFLFAGSFFYLKYFHKFHMIIAMKIILKVLAIRLILILNVPQG